MAVHSRSLWRMAREYHVSHADYISIPPRGAFVVIFDDDEHAFVLPLLTMTGLTYDLSKAAKA